MKKYMTPEVEVLNLNANDVIATSGRLGINHEGYNGPVGIGARGYDDEEEEW